jgi:hypothetical protein
VRYFVIADGDARKYLKSLIILRLYETSRNWLPSWHVKCLQDCSICNYRYQNVPDFEVKMEERLAYYRNSKLLRLGSEIFSISTCVSHYYSEPPQQLKATSSADKTSSKVRPIQRNKKFALLGRYVE